MINNSYYYNFIILSIIIFLFLLKSYILKQNFKIINLCLISIFIFKIHFLYNIHNELLKLFKII